ncbi:hypothetical protein [Bacteroides sp. UBA939]|uniref:hypothetical protein n=1 Tax=Bacteroides sp. UBA939 TaxID=1946092 RepID=UPI0025BF698D|nr:hypothetical protein [Bacteroides sp. UBA939]
MNIKEFYAFRNKLVLSTFQAHAVGLKNFHPIDADKHYIFDEHRLIQGDYNTLMIIRILSVKSLTHN